MSHSNSSSNNDNSSGRNMQLDNGSVIYEFEKRPENIINQITILFGPTDTGKTTLIKERIQLTRDYIPNWIILVPETSTEDYRTIFPACCIKTTVTKELLKDIWERQEKITECWKYGNNLILLESIFNKISDTLEKHHVKTARNKCEKSIQSIKSSELDVLKKNKQVSSLEKTRDLAIKRYMKRIIMERKSKINFETLNKEEKICMKFLNINPRLHIIIDDNSENFKAWNKMFNKNEMNVFNAILFRGRHVHITLTLVIHNDTILDTDMRRGAKSIIFMDNQSLVTFISKDSLGFTPLEKKAMIKMGERIYPPENSEEKSYMKFCLCRSDPKKYFHITAQLYPQIDPINNREIRTIDSLRGDSNNIDKNPFCRDITQTKIQKGNVRKKKELVIP